MNIFKSKTSMSEEKNTQSVTPSREKLIAELNYRIKSAELTARSARENKDMFLKVLDTVNAAMLENIKNKDIHRDDVRFEVRVVLRDSIMRFFFRGKRS